MLRSDEPFVWLQRRLDPQVSRAIAALDPKLIYKGGPIDFQEEPKRFYPQGSLGVHVVGFADVDQKGLAGIEQSFIDALPFASPGSISDHFPTTRNTSLSGIR